MEREFINTYLRDLSLCKKVIVVTPKVLPDFHHTLSRIIAFNSKFSLLLFKIDSKIDVNFSFNFIIPKRAKQLNEFIPTGTIEIPIGANTIKNVLIINKIKLDQPFSFNFKDVKYEFAAKKSESVTFRFSGVPYADSRYGQITNDAGVNAIFDSEDDDNEGIEF